MSAQDPQTRRDAPQMPPTVDTDAEAQCQTCGDCYAVSLAETKVLGTPSCCQGPTVVVRAFGYRLDPETLSSAA